MDQKTLIRTCEAKNKEGLRCTQPANEGSPFCSLHGPRRAKPPTIYDWAKNDYLKSLEERVQEFKDPRTFNLREEIGILRVVLERMLNSVHDDPSLLLASSEIQQTILTIERLLKTTHDMERQTGELMSRDEVREVTATLLQIMVEVLEDLAEREKQRFRRLSDWLEEQRSALSEDAATELSALIQTSPDIPSALEEIADRYADTLSSQSR